MKNAKSLNIQMFFGFRRKIFDDFQEFAVVVVNFFDDILDDFHDFFGMCLFPKKINNPIWGEVSALLCSISSDILASIVCTMRQSSWLCVCVSVSVARGGGRETDTVLNDTGLFEKRHLTCICGGSKRAPSNTTDGAEGLHGTRGANQNFASHSTNCPVSQSTETHGATTRESPASDNPSANP